MVTAPIPIITIAIAVPITITVAVGVLPAAVPIWPMLSLCTELMAALTSFSAILKRKILQP